VKNRTHTHRGHCQSCGRAQAVDVNHNKIAKHGYTVDFGFFNGVCTASDELPLEVEKTITERTISGLGDFINSQSSYLEGLETGKVKTLDMYWVVFSAEKEVEVVEYIAHSKPDLDRYYDNDKYCTQFAYLNGETFEGHIKLYNEYREANYDSAKSAEEVMERLIGSETKMVKANIAEAKSLKEQLIKMVDEVHGQPLINIADTEKILKELEEEARVGFFETKVVSYTDYRDNTEKKKNVYVLFDKEAKRETSIGTVSIKVSRPNRDKYKEMYRHREKVSVNCLLDGKRIARAKLIEKLQ